MTLLQILGLRRPAEPLDAPASEHSALPDHPAGSLRSAYPHSLHHDVEVEDFSGTEFELAFADTEVIEPSPAPTEEEPHTRMA